MTMTEPTDVDNDPALTSRRRFLREGGALVGGTVMAGGIPRTEALAAGDNSHKLPPQRPGRIKNPRRPMGSQPHWNPSPFRENDPQNIPQKFPHNTSPC